MKKTTVFFALLFAAGALCFSQNKRALSHFWDIPWGTTVDQAERIFGERGFSSVRDGNALITQAVYEREEATIMLLFNSANRLYSGNVIYSSSESTAIRKYENYRMVLFRRYGMPDTAVAYFASPYEKGDGREIEAITSENAFYFTEWQFQDDNLASVTILKNLDVCLSFKNPVYAGTGIGRR
jgi:hypothetical protein